MNKKKRKPNLLELFYCLGKSKDMPIQREKKKGSLGLYTRPGSIDCSFSSPTVKDYASLVKPFSQMLFGKLPFMVSSGRNFGHFTFSRSQLAELWRTHRIVITHWLLYPPFNQCHPTLNPKGDT